MIAIIAGTGNLPIEAAKSLLSQKKDFLIICLFPADNQNKILEIIVNRDKVISQPFYKAGQILKLLKEKNVTEILFIGKVDKNNLLKNIKLDWLAVKTLALATTKSDSTLMQAIINQVESQEFKILQQSDVLKNLFVPAGILTGNLTSELNEDIQFGLHTADKLSTIDIGQTVIVKDKMIIAVEAIEGTDSCIKRGIELGQNNIIICKTAHQNQNKKFDLPTLGPKSLEQIKKGQVKAIAWHSDKTFIENLPEFIERAKELEITLISVKR
ncbi:MAG: UDP-2,3-diacylglucosamine diphosphatase LpxI [bacterium]